MYAHMTAHGKHPFYVLGKGLFFRSSDLHAFGGFHPWLTIEDPEVGMRLWANGRRLGVVAQPLVEEVPRTFRQGVTQRKRWVCGFFQSLGDPLRQMGMTGRQRLRARLNLVPCLSLLVNPLGLAVGIWILALAILGDRPVDLPLTGLAVVNLMGAVTILAHNWTNAWKVSGQVLDSRRARLRLMLRLNPVFVMVYWLFWSVSMIIGIQMFIRDKGLVWERTEKVDANHDLVRELELTAGGGMTQTVQTIAAPAPVAIQPSAAQTSPVQSAPARSVPACSVPVQSARARSVRPLHQGRGRHRKPRSLSDRKPISSRRPSPSWAGGLEAGSGQRNSTRPARTGR